MTEDPLVFAAPPQPLHTTMYDTIGANASNIPQTALKIAGYTTGYGDVPWTQADWQRFPHAGHVLIRQDMDNYTPWDFDVLDVEPRACTIPDAVRASADRYHGRKWNTAIYIDKADVAVLCQQLPANGVPREYVQLFVADWDLNEQTAASMLGTTVNGYEIVAIQWASPTSNPHTVCPGDPHGRTLSELNIDLSVTKPAWFAPPATPAPQPQPQPQPQPKPENLTASLSIDRSGIKVQAPISSDDGGKTWH